MNYNVRIRHQLEQFSIEIVDLEGINEEKLLYQDCDIQNIIDRFVSQKVDAVFFRIAILDPKTE